MSKNEKNLTQQKETHLENRTYPSLNLCYSRLFRVQRMGTTSWFIPQSEPWRNGIVEKFNDLYQQNFLGKVEMFSEEDLKKGSLAFENQHNTSYRYSKLGGKTPLKMLASKGTTLRFPDPEETTVDWRERPKEGRYHLVRLIRSDLKLNVFGELFLVPPELELEYVVATIDVKDQNLTIFHDGKEVEQFGYIQ